MLLRLAVAVAVQTVSRATSAAVEVGATKVEGSYDDMNALLKSILMKKYSFSGSNPLGGGGISGTHAADKACGKGGNGKPLAVGHCK